jgi:proline iminopeptidase
MTASIASYVKYVTKLRQRFPIKIRETLKKYETKEEYDAPEYQEMVFKNLYTKHLCRLDPWPDPVMRTIKHLNTEVYNTMQGPNEFVVTGTFKDWDRWKEIRAIKVPTLLIVGRHDTMSVEDIQEMGKRISSSRVAICKKGAHFSMYDDQGTYFRELIRFIKDVEAERFK